MPNCPFQKTFLQKGTHMKKTSFLAILLTLVLLMTAAVPVGAATAEDSYKIAPCYINCTTANMDFAVTNNQAIVQIFYEGKPATFTVAKVTVKIQKKTLGVLWTTVDIGTANNEWIAYNNNVNGSFSKSFAVNGTGTYRAKITLEFYGISNTVDVIEDTIECKYK